MSANPFARRFCQAPAQARNFTTNKSRKAVLEVIQSRTLFRWYGPKPAKTVAALERDLAAFVATKYALAVTS